MKQTSDQIVIHLEESQLYSSFRGWAVKHHKAGRVRSRHDNIGPSVAIQITCRHAIDRSLAVAEWHRPIFLSRAAVGSGALVRNYAYVIGPEQERLTDWL